MERANQNAVSNFNRPAPRRIEIVVRLAILATVSAGLLAGLTLAPSRPFRTATNAAGPSPSFDASAAGQWTSGTSFTVTLTTSRSPDIVILWVSTYKASTAVSVAASSPNVAKWIARSSGVVSSSTTQTKYTELYGVANAPLSSEVITIKLSAMPTSAAAFAIAFSGVNTASPFDPGVFPNIAIATKASATVPKSGSWSTRNPNDVIVALYEGYTATTETAGVIAGTTATLGLTRAATGTSMAFQYRVLSATVSKQTAAFGTPTTYWAILTDALTGG